MAHDEIEQAGLGREPEGWHVVNIVDAEVVPTPRTFDRLQPALDYVRHTPGTLRIVQQVADDGERTLVDTSAP